MYIQIILFLLFSPIAFSYEQSLTPWFCTKSNELDSTIETPQTLSSCLPGYAIDIDDVVYESTTDGECSGKRLCSLHNKNTLTFACNRKHTCSLKIRQFRFHINSTCGSTVRFFIKYRCLPVIQEQKDYLCDSSIRRGNFPDINLSCENNYRLYIKMALVGISIKQQDHKNNNHFQCNKDTYWLCNHYVPDAYRNVCNRNENQCQIRYNDRPRLKGCQYGESSNFSLVEYLCIPGEGIRDDLPRIDICSTDISEDISINRGLIHSPNYPYSLGNYLKCKKQLYITRESRVRLFMLEKSLEYSHELNIRLLNNEPNIQRTLVKNELFDTNITNQQKNEILEIQLKTNHVGGGNFLLYFQVDSRISEYAPLILEADRKTDDYNRKKKSLVKRDWGIVIGSLIGLVLVLLVIAIVLLIIRILKRRRAKSLKYLKGDDDHRQHLNTSTCSSDHHHHPKKPIQIEHPHLLSSSVIGTNHHRPNSSTSIITNDDLSDRESLLKQPSRATAISTNIDNFYEEIKEQQQQANLALGNNQDINPYLEPKSFEDRKKFFEDNKSSQPIRDHRETEQRSRRPAPLALPENSKNRLESATCDAPMASTETLDVAGNPTNSERLKRPKQPPPKIPPPRMDLNHPQPSAPPLHLLEHDNNTLNENLYPHQRMRQSQPWNNQNQNT